LARSRERGLVQFIDVKTKELQTIVFWGKFGGGECVMGAEPLTQQCHVCLRARAQESVDSSL